LLGVDHDSAGLACGFGSDLLSISFGLSQRLLSLGICRRPRLADVLFDLRPLAFGRAESFLRLLMDARCVSAGFDAYLARGFPGFPANLLSSVLSGGEYQFHMGPDLGQLRRHLERFIARVGERVLLVPAREGPPSASSKRAGKETVERRIGRLVAILP
jgi:hypothetical protein